MLLSGCPSEHLHSDAPFLARAAIEAQHQISCGLFESSTDSAPQLNLRIVQNIPNSPTIAAAFTASSAVAATSTAPSAHSGCVHAPSARHVRDVPLLAPLYLARRSHPQPHPIPRSRPSQSRATPCGRPSPHPHAPRPSQPWRAPRHHHPGATGRRSSPVPQFST
jgi:hypothetical protein